MPSAEIRPARHDGVVPTSVNQLTVTAELAALGEIIYELPSWERGRLPGIEADARRVPAGVAVTEVLMEATGMGELTVSEWGLREGIIVSTIAKHDSRGFSNDPRAIRYASVLSLCHRSRWPRSPFPPGRGNGGLAFNSTGAVHELDGGDPELLELAALLHDIGELVDRDSHTRHSAYPSRTATCGLLAARSRCWPASGAIT